MSVCFTIARANQLTDYLDEDAVLQASPLPVATPTDAAVNNTLDAIVLHCHRWARCGHSARHLEHIQTLLEALRRHAYTLQIELRDAFERDIDELVARGALHVHPTLTRPVLHFSPKRVGSSRASALSEPRR
ncbi:hypothetical protein JJL56_01545 [Azospirillum sp. YIM DDC1]|uniref:Uncharacterized protein n=1 Tax=Azospirillum aestuarii TaxID=2802052 RepID=A0ABS1HRU7_9PROT|nr:hypothetical protein [Azospirillum aestuarii]MBK4717546.1 hypothetical protein [Azospirillum aestuarii]